MFALTATGRLLVIVATSGAAAVGVGSAATASADSTLMGMLPQGFSSSNCQVQTPKPPGLEKVNCDQSSDPTGPAAAVFARYGSLDDLATAFRSADITVDSTCPGGQQSPGPWTFGSSGQTGGLVECGSVAGGGAASTVVVWTDNAKLRAGAVRGADITSLYQWWKAKSG